MTPQDRAAAGFAAHFGAAPDGVVFAPGRVNLIGEHVDYNGGLVLPMPIAVGTAIAWRARADSRVAAVALDYGNATDDFLLADPANVDPFDWRGYLRGMAACMAERGLPLVGADLAVAGSIPRGSGLSSSASLCIATGRALAAAAAGQPPPDALELSLAGQMAEHRYAGVKCGIMDQLAIAAGEPGSAVLIDCRALTTEVIQLPHEWAVMIVQSGVERGLVDGHYNARRADCEAAAAALGVESLRDATREMVDAAPIDLVIRARARHVVSDIARAARAVEAIAAHDLAALGRLFAQSHASMRDDFEITVPAVDRLAALLADTIGEQGGARMTGGGFGGAVVAILHADAVERVRATVLEHYRTPSGAAPDIMIERFAPFGRPKNEA
ncbi:galactokinase [Novosphingobium lentum]|uniref:galactokinase n=1 Tax=Novosphingobium lentum TaxID=145287 RepID=UPI000832C98A|nr:galactokinase [Novosphingobium lentum]